MPLKYLRHHFFFFSSKHLAKFWCHQFNIRYKYNIVRWLVTSGFDLLFDIIQLGTRNSRSYSSMVVPGSELSLPTFRFNLLILYNSDPSILMGPNTQIWHRMCYLSRKKYKCLTVSKLLSPPPPPPPTPPPPPPPQTLLFSYTWTTSLLFQPGQNTRPCKQYRFRRDS